MKDRGLTPIFHVGSCDPLRQPQILEPALAGVGAAARAADHQALAAGVELDAAPTRIGGHRGDERHDLVRCIAAQRQTAVVIAPPSPLWMLTNYR